jgi:small-conductance mechanosensitive channel
VAERIGADDDPRCAGRGSTRMPSTGGCSAVARPSYTRVFGALYMTVIVGAAVLLAMTLAFPSVRMVDVLASLGIVSVAVGFAFKDVLENVLAEVLLLLRDPFKSGDEIRVGEHEGTVEGVTIRETLPRTPAGQRVLLPNAQVYTSALEVLTHCPATWITFAVVLDVAADLDQATPVMQTALRAVEEVVSDPAPQVVVTDLGVGTVTPECRRTLPT